MPGLREALEKGYDELDKASDSVPESAPVPAPVEPPAEVIPAVIADTTGGAERDEKGRFKPIIGKSQEGKPAPAEAPGAKPAKAAPSLGQVPAAGAVPSPPAPVAAPVLSDLKAPQSWKTLERESWSKVPTEAQQAILRREKEINQTLQQSTEARKSWERFQQSIEPFKPLIATVGGDPVASTAQLWQTMAQLQMGNPEQVASVAASIITNFGVGRFGPQFVEKVAAYLNGQPGPQMQQPQGIRREEFDSMFEQRLQGLQEKMLSQRAQTELEKFEENAPEFYNHPGVRQRMARILEANDEDGIALNYQEAYDLAVASHQEIRKVLEQRAAAQSVSGQQAATQRARTAASSVRSQPAAAGSAQPKGLRAVLDEKADELGIR